MKLNAVGRKVTLKDDFLTRVDKRLSKMDKYFSDEAQAFLTVTVGKDHQTVELTIKDRDFSVRGERTAPAMEQAFDAAADIVVRQVNRNRERLQDRLRTGAAEELAAAYPDEKPDAHSVVREKHFPLRPETVEEAMLRMDLLGHSFYMFRSAETGEINLLYRRNDGDYGLIIPTE